MFKHILFPTDGTELSRKAQDAAVDLARTLGARITAIHSTPAYAPQLADMSFVYGEPMLPEDYQQIAKKASEDILARFEADAGNAGVACDSISVVAASPWNAIVSAAAKGDCDVIVMASHGRHGISGVLLGSETQKVLAHSTLPVLVYR